MFQETYMYFTPLFGIFTVVSFVMLLAGNLYAMYKMHTNSTSFADTIHKRSLEHTEKCGCCGQEKPKDESSVVDAVVEKAVDVAKKFV